MKVLELFSGIGGMHLALKESGIDFEVKAAVEINPISNIIYNHNFPNTPLLNKNIEGLSGDFIRNLGVDTILMSPPCQPFTRNGLKRDINDARCKPFVHILNLLPNLNIERLLIENVKGFETSEMRELLVETLKKCGYKFQEFLLTPTQFGVPNSRLRYYCIVKKGNFNFPLGEMMYNHPFIKNERNCFEIKKHLDIEYSKEKYKIPSEKYNQVLDICDGNSTNTCCFTKAYTRYLEGSGSVFRDENGLRFFTPREVCRLMCFPENFTFPQNITDKQKYKTLGNSINIKVVAQLINLF